MRRKAEVLHAGIICLLAVLLCREDAGQAWAQENIQRYSEVFDDPGEIPEPEKLIHDEAGREYRLKEQEIAAVPVSGRTEKLSGQTVYEGVSRGDTIPDTAAMTVRDEESGTEFETELSLERVEYTDERWQTGFSFTATFHEYGADYYILGETRIPHREDRPELSEVGEQLLREIGMEPEDCLLDDFIWQGEPYRDGEENMCRDALISGRKKVWDCTAVYGGVVKMPDYKRYRMIMTYEVGEEESEENGESVEVADVPISAEENGETSEPTLWDRLKQMIRRGIQVSVGIFCIAAAVLVLRFLLKMAKSAGKEEL
ncbi:hypothetical protein [Clostridium transplantifaecale]|uniref:hypothetical protein n=1 Tax=Clostridium transplantifaecale TaxID=2479838 RepID=UPI000F639740|nr:hypothetical protein [Clostridium transplantifaecale]